MTSAFSLHSLTFRSIKRSSDMFESKHGFINDDWDSKACKMKLALKAMSQYGVKKESTDDKTLPTGKEVMVYDETNRQTSSIIPLSEVKSRKRDGEKAESKELIIQKKAKTAQKPDWHAPWKLCRVTSGHTGWVRCISFSPDNEFFMTGSDDRLLKIWDFQTGKLRLSLTGHVSGVRGVKISDRHPYAFSCGEDKMVKCWDLEQNKVIRHYHGHNSAVYALDLHPTLDVIMTGGRDSVIRVWDMRTKVNVHVLQGHRDAIASLRCQDEKPEIISGSHDNTVRLWDLRKAQTSSVLTNHKKAVRAVDFHPNTPYMIAASADAIKQFALPDGNFVQNLRGHNTIINAITVSSDNVVVSGGNDGSLYFWDWKTGYNFQKLKSEPQPGSLDAENSILALAFDRTCSRLITAEGDKTIKFYMEDPTATEETHPVQWRRNIVKSTIN